MQKTRVSLLLAAALFLAGCGGIEDVKESTVTVNEKGVITQRLIEDFDTETYEAGEMKSQVRDLVKSYNQGAGKESVSLKSADVKDGKATVELTYTSDDAYRGFNQVDFFAGTVEEAKKEGYRFAGDFVDGSGKDAEAGVVPDQCASEQVIILREPLSVLVPGTITYTSKNMKIQGKNTAKLVNDTDLEYENGQVVTDAYGYVIYKVQQ